MGTAHTGIDAIHDSTIHNPSNHTNHTCFWHTCFITYICDICDICYKESGAPNPACASRTSPSQSRTPRPERDKRRKWRSHTPTGRFARDLNHYKIRSGDGSGQVTDKAQRRARIFFPTVNGICWSIGGGRGGEEEAVMAVMAVLVVLVVVLMSGHTLAVQHSLSTNPHLTS